MAQQLRRTAALPEDPGSVPSLHVAVSLGPGDLMPSSSFFRNQACTRCIDIHVGKIPIYIK